MPGEKENSQTDKMKRVGELPRLRKRDIKSGIGGEREGKGKQDILKMTDEWEEKRETGNYQQKDKLGLY